MNKPKKEGTLTQRYVIYELYVFLEANQKPAPKQYFEEEKCVAYPQKFFLFKTFHTASLI
jgi:hypothetical protein